MASKSNDKQRDLRFTLAELEQLTTHQMAELLANCVLLLRRLPDVPFSALAQLPTEQDQASNTGGDDDLVNKAKERVNGHDQPIWWAGKDKK